MTPNYVYFCFAMCVSITLCGCNSKPYQPPSSIRGIVLTSPNTDGSVAINAIGTYPGDEPVTGATIRLTLDKKGEEPIQGAVATSDDSGYYSLPIPQLPPEKPDVGSYYLTVEKKGYQTLHWPIRFGPYADDPNKTVYLAPKDRESKNDKK